MAARVTVRYRPIAVIPERLDFEDVSRLGKAICLCRLRMPREEHRQSDSLLFSTLDEYPLLLIRPRVV